jgi:hypothetical protein
MKFLRCWLLAGLAFLPVYATAAENARADVAVIVDTSTSMTEPGMDPERASLLVAKLLADIVPGDLAVIRLLDLGDDKALLPSRPTGKTMPCKEDVKKTCNILAPTADWDADARAQRYGALIRPSRADADYKRALERHLQQAINNSLFNLAFQAALGVFDQHAGNAAPRAVIWLSDGHADNEALLQKAVDQAKAGGASIEAIVFGAGDVGLPQRMGVAVLQASTPAAIMKAFANAFRRIVQAPYRIDNLLSAEPRFEMKRNVNEAWIVVYGDSSLASAEIEGPGGAAQADYATDSWPAAGAYRVAYLQRPRAGQWTVKARGGGAGVAYAVIQRSELMPVLSSPAQALAGVEVPLAVEIRAGADGEIITDPDLLQDAAITAEIEGRAIRLLDNGEPGDAAAHDGRYGGLAIFAQAGEIPVRLHLQSALAERANLATVQVGGRFSYSGGPLELDLGKLGVGAESCRPLRFPADHQGAVAFELKSLKTPPSGHLLEMRMPSGFLSADGGAAPLKPGEALNLCLKTTARVSSSQADGEPWLALQVAGSDKPEHQIVLKLRWQVLGLSFWALWGWLVWTLLALATAVLILLGFILPQRFQGALALVFVPEREDLDEQSPQPIKQWRGVGAGFYRSARAYLHPDYRLSGKERGALAGLFAERGGARVAPGAGASLFRETLQGDWAPVPVAGCRCRAGDVYRVGHHGPYFRIVARG